MIYFNSASQSKNEIAERFETRQNLWFEKCQESNDPHLDTVDLANNHWPTKERGEIIINTKVKLLGCLVKKAGYSSWHKVFWDLANPGKPVVKGFGALAVNSMREVPMEIWEKACFKSVFCKITNFFLRKLTWYSVAYVIRYKQYTILVQKT